VLRLEGLRAGYGPIEALVRRRPDETIVYEWDFCNVNPPVHAWAAWNVYQQEKTIYGVEDKDFLERILDKLNITLRGG
jgi:hypothetical protein